MIINVISRDRAPRWLEEGFAIYLAGEGEMFSRYLRRGKLTTEELEKRLQSPSTQSDMRSLYAEAYLKVNEMVRNEGEAKVWKRLAGELTAATPGTARALAHKRIIFNPKPPRLIHPLLSVIDPNPRPARDLTRRDRNSLFKPHSVAKQVRFI